MPWIPPIPLPVTFIDAIGTPSSSTFLRGDGFWGTPAGGGGGGSAVSLVGVALTSSMNTGNTTVSVTVPTTQADDLIVMATLFRNSFQFGGPADTGWEFVQLWGILSQAFTGESTNNNMGIWVKRATGAQSSVDFNVVDNGTDAQRWTVGVFRGALGIRDFKIMGHEGYAPSVWGIDGGMLFCIWGTIFDSGTFDAPPADMTVQTNGNSGFADTRAMSATKVLTSPGHTNIKIATHTSMNQWVGNMSISIY